MFPEYAPGWNKRMRVIVFLALLDLEIWSRHLALDVRPNWHLPIVLEHARGGINIYVQRVRRLSLPEDDIAAGKVYCAKVSNELDLPYERKLA